ncbi:nuclear transport factor 2 family protein [Gordonia sp. DT218]|uniref:nuclear transport factor 2 family protein n=1 Tax=Gordonia sp. DT218 TaxID=3416659 RepID=UPI003CF6C5D8
MTTTTHELQATATRLSVDYAYAIDARDWDLFASVFTDDVVVEYKGMPEIRGITQWLDYFIPFHDECTWTSHVMTNHRSGQGPDGAWAICYGDVRWLHRRDENRLNHALNVYRDELRYEGNTWRIARRRMDVVLSDAADITSAGIHLPASMHGIATGS